MNTAQLEDAENCVVGCGYLQHRFNKLKRIIRSKSLGKGEIQSFQISFFVYLLICIFSYLYFLLNNRNE